MNKFKTTVTVLAGVLLACICAPASRAEQTKGSDDLTGAWRGRVQFTTGGFAAIKDLEFMYAFNDGGTMTESSNYDGAPPVPPAYGVWRKVGARKYEARYEFFWTKAPANLEEITKGGGWSPGGHGVLMQKISLSEDGKSFDSTITLELFDQQGKPTEAAAKAVAKGSRIRF